jgi:peptidoglycan/LPS O-acetylase OafA/YrhL
MNSLSKLATIEVRGPRAIPLRASRSSSFYRPELDALRFFAFFGVFRFHFAGAVDRYVAHGAPRWVVVANSVSYAGAFGVDLFFVLSAYLITELLLREKSKRGMLDVRAFYIRRILRIWPLYFFAIGLALVPVFNPVHGFTWRYATAFLLLAGNWSIIAWGWPMHTIANPLWTISVEEQFYLLWPPIVRTLSRNRIVFAAAAMLIASTGMRILMVAFHGGMDSVRCNTLGRLDPIAAGILVAATLRGRIPNFSIFVRLGMLCCGMLPLVLVAHYWKIEDPEALLWIPTLVGFPVVAASCTLIMLAALGVSIRPPVALLYLGKISYGLYVYHALASFLSDKFVPVRTHFRQLVLREMLALAITVLLASASYALLEKPFLRLKKRFEHIRSRPV